MSSADIILAALFLSTFLGFTAAVERVGSSDYCRCPRCLLRAARRWLRSSRYGKRRADRQTTH